MPRALVTGATGLVGSHVVERLLAEGWDVRALVRQPSTAAWLAARRVEIVGGDTLDETSFVAAARGCDAVFHNAAAVTPRGGWEAYRRPNVDGTANAITAAERAGARLVHLSSVAVYGPQGRYAAAASGGRTTEDAALGALPEGALYARSKRDSESLVMQAHAEGRLWATALRPSVIYGPRDRQFVPRIARILRFGIAPIVGSGSSTLSVVHAANVADGVVRAATSDVAGGRAYNLANDYDVAVADFFRLAGEGLGRRVRLLRLPKSVASAAMYLVKAGLALTTGGSLSVVATTSLDFLTKDNPFASERARRELGWAPPVRPDEGIPASFRWWREHAQASGSHG